MNATMLQNTWQTIMGLGLTTANKRWLAAHLYAVADEESLVKSSTSKIWPKLTKQDLIISPEIMDLVRDVEPASVDFDADAARLEYLMKKHG